MSAPGARSLAAERIGTDERVTMAIGSEGGWLPYEVDAFERAGFVAISTGERILRVETACVALMAQVDLLRQMR